MRKISLTKIAIAVSTFACAGLLSVGWSEQRGVSLSVESAQARVGRPLTPVSVAGVARRQNRRAAYQYAGSPNNIPGLVGGMTPVRIAPHPTMAVALSAPPQQSAQRPLSLPHSPGGGVAAPM